MARQRPYNIFIVYPNLIKSWDSGAVAQHGYYFFIYFLKFQKYKKFEIKVPGIPSNFLSKFTIY